MSLIWRVDSPPTGRYRSFSRRGWPHAYHPEDNSPAAMIQCEDEYVPSRVKIGQHAELVVSIADHSIRRGKTPEQARELAGFIWRRLKQRCKTLDEAKALAEAATLAHPTFKPLPGER